MRSYVTVADARWAQRHLRRGCAVVGMPNLSRYIRVAWLSRFPKSDRDAIGVATVGIHHTHVGRGRRPLVPGRLAVDAYPFRIRLLRSWWARADWAERSHILMHELAHILCELRGETCHAHGRRFDKMLARLTPRGKTTRSGKGRTR